jgi:chromosome segregation ATPase
MKRSRFAALALAALSLASCSRFARSQPAVIEDASPSAAGVSTPATVTPSADASVSNDSGQQSKELAHELADTCAPLATSESAPEQFQQTLDASRDTAKQQASRLADRLPAARKVDVNTPRADPPQSHERSANRLRELGARAKQLDPAKTELQPLQRESEDRKPKAEGLQRQVADLRASATQQQTEQRAKDEKPRAQIAELSSHAENREQELATYKQARESTAASAERVELEQTSVSAEGANRAHRSDESLADRALLTKRPGDHDGRALDPNTRDPQARIAELEKELADVKKSSQSRLEALENVLKNTRASGADLRSQLDETRARNAELSEQVGALKGSVSKLHDLRTTLVDREHRLAELDSQNVADSGEVKKLKSQVAALEADLNKARSLQQASTTSVKDGIQKMATPQPDPDASGATPPGTDNADVREQLSLERERRQTLEQEVQRLTASSKNEERYMEVWNALQSARSEILVLSNQLADERRSREEFEVALSRLREQSGDRDKSSADFARRLSDTLNERRAEADRLAGELKNANETIVKLKGRIEAKESSLGDNKALEDLNRENETLRRSLAAAEAARQALQSKADMAEHLAEMVYGNH